MFHAIHTDIQSASRYEYNIDPTRTLGDSPRTSNPRTKYNKHNSVLYRPTNFIKQLYHQYICDNNNNSTCPTNNM